MFCKGLFYFYIYYAKKLQKHTDNNINIMCISKNPEIVLI